MKKTVNYISTIIFLAILFSDSIISSDGLDENGNPIFNSINLEEKEYDEYGISANYYTILNNIENPNSSVFVSEDPTNEEVMNFAINLPSYFWIIHINNKVSKLVSLHQKYETFLNMKWYFLVVDVENQTSKEFPINIKMIQITEHRRLELEYGKDLVEQELSEKNKRIFHSFGDNKIYGVLPYLKIYEKLLKFIDTTKLFSPDINIENVEYIDNEE